MINKKDFQHSLKAAATSMKGIKQDLIVIENAGKQMLNNVQFLQDILDELYDEVKDLIKDE